jgi:2-keto-4-pentenoate hydratase/2-oxohepta-3-ene-1,7-dioic acid hydratase in catechol pathway
VRLATFQGKDGLAVGVAISATDVVELIELVGDLPPSMATNMIELIIAGPSLLRKIHEAVVAGAPAGAPRHAIAGLDWRAPVLTPSKIVCVALNNRALDSIKIRAPTDHPAFFIKTQSALVGCNHPIRMKTSFGLTHPEPELAVIIGKQITEATPQEALEAVFGYTIMNDVTSVGMRDEDSFTFRYFKPDPVTGQTAEAHGHTTYPGRYKGTDTFAPLGPFIVTKDEVANPDALEIKCWLGEKLVAHDNTSNYVWSVANALSQISQTMTLLPGDVVAMGTAVGAENAGAGGSPVPSITKANLVNHTGPVVVEIAGLGRLSNPIVTKKNS